MSRSDIAVSVRGLSKSYTIARQGERHITLAESLLARARRPFARAPKETFWALKDVEFDIKKGDVVGIIGRNGAGKSTLLKILSRITQPTAGQIDLYGRVGSLLEVGTGFHPELTGRENVFLNGAILGMTKAEIRRQFDAIVDFAGVEQFLDTPVKRYSSGMYVRLAFAVAAHLQSDILIVDEVLAVGDASFQSRCLTKMDEVSKAGRTVLLVSHNAAAISKFCSLALLLSHGQLGFSGATRQAIDLYTNDAMTTSGEYRPESGARPPTDKFCLVALRVRNMQNSITGRIDIQNPFSIEIIYRVLRQLPRVRVTISLTTSDGTFAFTSKDSLANNLVHDIRQVGRYSSTCKIPGDFLNAEPYYISVSADIPYVEVLWSEERILKFDVIQTGGIVGTLPERWPGVVSPRLPWHIGESNETLA